MQKLSGEIQGQQLKLSDMHGWEVHTPSPWTGLLVALQQRDFQCSKVCRDLILNKTKIVVAQASSAYKHSLREVLESPGIAGQIKVGYCCLPSHLEGFM